MESEKDFNQGYSQEQIAEANQLLNILKQCQEANKPQTHSIGGALFKIEKVEEVKCTPSIAQMPTSVAQSFVNAGNNAQVEARLEQPPTI